MTEIRVGLGATINTGNFESVRVDYSESRVVGPSDDLAKVREELYESVDNYLSDKIKEIHEDLS